MRTARTRAPEGEETMSDTTEAAPRTRTARTSRAGFNAYNKTVDNLNKTTFQVKDNTEIIAFLDPANFHFALRHWVKFIGEDGKQQTRAEWCLSIEDEDGEVNEEEFPCPLCEIGDRPKPVAFFNVVDLAFPNKVLVWEASSDPTKAIEKEFNKLAKTGRKLNDDGLYWAISREQGRNGFYTYSVDKVTEEDLTEHWKSVKPLNGAQRDALRHRAYDETYVELKERDEIEKFVETL